MHHVSERDGCGRSRTYKVSAFVAEYSPPDPMAAAAAIWTAHPQSIEAMAKACEIGGRAGRPRGFAPTCDGANCVRIWTLNDDQKKLRLCSWSGNLQPTIHANRFLQRGEDNECVQK